MKLHFSLLVLLCTISCFFLSNELQGQAEIRNNIPLIINNDTLESGWTGGVNHPIWGQMELNGDSFPDVVIFDSHDHIFIPMINKGGLKPRYAFAPEYYESFKNCNCEWWARFKDYDHDGDIDIFCGDTQDRISLYENAQSDGKAFFKLKEAQMKEFQAINPNTTILSSKIYLPDFEDLDGDGDLDFLTWPFTGGNTAVAYVNAGVDSFGNADTMALQFETYCWGHFAENSTFGTIDLHQTTFCNLRRGFDPQANGCLKKSGKRLEGTYSSSEKHIGGTNLLLDMDGDKSFDLLLGDVSVSTIFYLHNCGRPDYAYIDTAHANFPAYDTSIDLFQSPALTYMDFDNDGIRDLMVGTFDVGDEFSENKNPMMWYENIGADDAPVFSYRQRGILSNRMADLGRMTKPCLMDVNADGLLDMIVGHGGVFNRSDSSFTHGLHLYENVGNQDVPAFKLVDSDFLNTSATPFEYPAPTAGDIDKDGDLDLLIGQSNGEIAFYENTAGANMPATFQYKAKAYQGIDVGKAAVPFLHDMDKDGDLDLLVGHELGSIAYYRNTTSGNMPVFTFITDKWGFFGVRDRFGRQDLGKYAAPMLLDIDNDNEVELMVGNESGDIQMYEGVSTALLDTLRYVGSLINGFDFGAHSAPVGAIMDSTGDISYIVGDIRGGFMLANSLPPALISISPITSVEPELEQSSWNVRLYPNPTHGSFSIEHDEKRDRLFIQIMNATGKEIVSHQELPTGTQHFSLQTFPAGVYFIRISNTDHSETFSIIKK